MMSTAYRARKKQEKHERFLTRLDEEKEALRPKTPPKIRNIWDAPSETKSERPQTVASNDEKEKSMINREQWNEIVHYNKAKLRMERVHFPLKFVNLFRISNVIT